jgi:hypothetical protein
MKPSRHAVQSGEHQRGGGPEGSSGPSRPHPFLILQRLAGNGAVSCLVQRAPGTPLALGPASSVAAPAVPTSGPMTRADFDSVMAQMGVTVRTGTLDTQVAELNLLSGPAAGGPPTGD